MERVRDAATVMLVRDRPDLHVFVLQRNSTLDFVPGATVFPGGAVDPEDAAVASGLGVDEFRAGCRPRVSRGSAASRSMRASSSSSPRWITPEGAPRRYDTRFFVVRAPDGSRRCARRQRAGRVGMDASGRCLCVRSPTGEIDLILPTQRSLEVLARFDRVDCAAGRAARGHVPDLTPESPSALSPLVRRVVANNPGLMTGPGTNTYLVGIDEVAVIDPGPDLARHIDAIIGASMSERVRWILLTHTHPDHWPAAAKIAKKTGARIAGFSPFPKADEVTLELDIVLADGDTIDGTEFRLEALHTPGHAPNHLCFWLDEERTLFTGDHVLNGTTTVVNPQRGGDMIQYLASLDRLRKIKRVARICPGHGDVMEDPAAVLDEYVAHRKMRERQILKVLKAKPATIPKIVSHALHRHPRRPLGDGAAPGARAPAQAEGRGQGLGQRRQDQLDRRVTRP